MDPSHFRSEKLVGNNAFGTPIHTTTLLSWIAKLNIPVVWQKDKVDIDLKCCLWTKIKQNDKDSLFLAMYALDVGVYANSSITSSHTLA